MVLFDRSSICLTVFSVVLPRSFDRLCVHIRSSLKFRVCMYVCIYIYIYIGIYMFIHIHIYIYIYAVKHMPVKQMPERSNKAMVKQNVASVCCFRAMLPCVASRCCLRVMFNYARISAKQVRVGQQQTLSVHNNRSTCLLRTEGPLP